MSTRIRYVPSHTENNTNFVSLKTYTLGDNTEVKVHIIPYDGSFSLTDATTGAVVFTGTGSSLVSLKSKAKKKLVELGVVFETETRNTVVV